MDPPVAFIALNKIILILNTVAYEDWTNHLPINLSAHFFYLKKNNPNYKAVNFSQKKERNYIGKRNSGEIKDITYLGRNVHL